jgi:hypothetical protein
VSASFHRRVINALFPSDAPPEVIGSSVGLVPINGMSRSFESERLKNFVGTPEVPALEVSGWGWGQASDVFAYSSKKVCFATGLTRYSAAGIRLRIRGLIPETTNRRNMGGFRRVSNDKQRFEAAGTRRSLSGR